MLQSCCDRHHQSPQHSMHALARRGPDTRPARKVRRHHCRNCRSTPPHTHNHHSCLLVSWLLHCCCFAESQKTRNKETVSKGIKQKTKGIDCSVGSKARQPNPEVLTYCTLEADVYGVRHVWLLTMLVCIYIYIWFFWLSPLAGFGIE